MRCVVCTLADTKYEITKRKFKYKVVREMNVICISIMVLYVKLDGVAVQGGCKQNCNPYRCSLNLDD